MSALVTRFAYRMGAYEYLHAQGFTVVGSDNLWLSDDGLITARVTREGEYNYVVDYYA